MLDGDRELAEASSWVEHCVHRCKNRDKLKRKVIESCCWIDTETINGFHQRFSTELLRSRLYLTYFLQIVNSVVNRAEIVATERQIMRLQQELSINANKLREREGGMVKFNFFHNLYFFTHRNIFILFNSAHLLMI